MFYVLWRAVRQFNQMNFANAKLLLDKSILWLC